MSAVHIVYASTSGHTEHVVTVLAEFLRGKKVEVTVQRAEQAGAADFAQGDLLILASSTWNTGNVEGQLNPHMFTLFDRVKDIALNGKQVALVALGDERYRYRANAAVHMDAFVKSHGGKVFEPILKILNEPFGQEKVVTDWARALPLKA